MFVRIELHTAIGLFICIHVCLIGRTAICPYDYTAICACVHTAVCTLQRTAVPTYRQLIIRISDCPYGYPCGYLFACPRIHLYIPYYNQSFICLYIRLSSQPYGCTAESDAKKY
jgi:hypothetical protein